MARDICNELRLLGDKLWSRMSDKRNQDELNEAALCHDAARKIKELEDELTKTKQELRTTSDSLTRELWNDK